MHTLYPVFDYVKKLGRAGQINNELWMCYSASGAAFQFEGKQLQITLTGDDRCEQENMKENLARVKVFVDGICTHDLMMDEKEKKVSIIEANAKENHLVEIIKVSESAMSTCGIRSLATDENAVVKPAQRKERYIEFAGDSITCGYGVDDEVAEHSFKTSTEDATKAYAYLTAQALKADHSLVSLSGYGIISGYSGDGVRRPDQLLPTYYEKMGFSYGSMQGVYPQDVAWNFENRQPDVVVINLGTNDQSFTRNIKELCEEYCSAYRTFIRKIRSKNPNAYIVSMLGVMGEDLCPFAEKAVATYQAETGDARVSFHRFTEQLNEDGRAADWHPSQITHRKTADKLMNIIKGIMNWS